MTAAGARVRAIGDVVALPIVMAAAMTLVVLAVMNPPMSEAIQVGIAFGTASAAAVAIATASSRLMSSLTRWAIVVSVAGPLFITGALMVGASAMFVSQHDRNFLLALAALTAVLSGYIGHRLSRPMTRRLARLRELIDQIEGGAAPDSLVAPPYGAEAPDEIDALAGAMIAMTERLAEAERRRDRVEAERALMITALSHDARTPLTAARAAVEALQDGMSPDPERYLASVHDDLVAVETLLDDLLLLGRLEAGDYRGGDEQLDLAQLAAATADELMPIADGREVTLEIETPTPAPVEVTGSAKELSRVLRNLVDNAIRHSPPGSAVSVAVERTNEGTQVTVRDPGPGFPAEFVDSAFTPFARAEAARDRLHGGAGLGLTVAKGVIGAHGGEIWAEPGPGGLVAFRL